MEDNEKRDELQPQENNTEPTQSHEPEQPRPEQPGTSEPEQPVSEQQTTAGAESQQGPVDTPPPPEHNPAEVKSDSRNLGLLCHLLGLFTSFIGPLVLWLIKKDEDSYVDHHGKEALNFQITVLIGYIVSGILSFVCIGFILALVVGIFDIVYCILATVAASDGKLYRYPVSIRLVQ